MKTLKNLLKTAVPVLGLSFGILKGFGQDYINYRKYNDILLIFNYSILNDPDSKEMQEETLIQTFNTTKGKLIFKYSKYGESDYEIYNKRGKLIYKHKDLKEGTDIDKRIREI